MAVGSGTRARLQLDLEFAEMLACAQTVSLGCVSFWLLLIGRVAMSRGGRSKEVCFGGCCVRVCVFGEEQVVWIWFVFSVGRREKREIVIMVVSIWSIVKRVGGVWEW